jgi:hypothetical protein
MASNIGTVKCFFDYETSSVCSIGTWGGLPTPETSIEWFVCDDLLDSTCTSLGSGYKYLNVRPSGDDSYDYWALARNSSLDTVLALYQGKSFYFIVTARNSSGSHSFAGKAGNAVYAIKFISAPTLNGSRWESSDRSLEIGQTINASGGDIGNYASSLPVSSTAILKCSVPLNSDHSYTGSYPEQCLVVSTGNNSASYTLSEGDTGYYFAALRITTIWEVSLRAWSSTSNQLMARSG